MTELPEPAGYLDTVGDVYTATQMKEYGEAMRRAAIEEVRSTVLAAGLAKLRGNTELPEPVDLANYGAPVAVYGYSESQVINYGDRRAAAMVPPGYVVVPVEPTREMLNAAVDVDSFKLGDISPIGFRCSPQQLFERCYTAMLEAAPKEQTP